MSVDIKYNNISQGILPINKTAVLPTKNLFMDYDIELVDNTPIYSGEIIHAIPINELSLLYQWSEIDE